MPASGRRSIEVAQVAISVFDIFKVGIGPSSSHTMGPMRAARAFLLDVKGRGLLEKLDVVTVELYGSLALTGAGHGTDRAVILGLLGEKPDEVNPDRVAATLESVASCGRLRLLGEREIAFGAARHLRYHRNETLPRHSNGMRFTAAGASGGELAREEYYSIGGGFIVRGTEDEPAGAAAAAAAAIPYEFGSAAELLGHCRRTGLRIHELMLENEKSRRSEEEVRGTLLTIWQVMKECVERGLHHSGMLPGELHVIRRAPKLYQDLLHAEKHGAADVMDWVNAYAMAVNEENAAGGRVVTAPTNGAAGIVPAALHYYERFEEGANEEGVIRFLLTAAAIAILYKKNAGISGAEMGCQGEVGVACSMAAGGIVAAAGGSNEQIENAAEIGMEHNLGLTCDPVGGLVQIPCIERNAMGAVKAINAARMAIHGDGRHKVSLDQVIKTMRQTGTDMQSIYKETSLGGLAVNVPEC